jgi:hypothetical protein
MTRDEVHGALTREPFVPLRLHLASGKTFDVTFREMARLVRGGLLVFIGMKRGTHQAKSYDVFGFDRIERIQPRPAAGQRKRAS